MERDVIAFVSLGFGCGGPEMGDYGKFTVDLTADEWQKVDKLAKDPSVKPYKRTTLAKRYPEIDKKIRAAGQDLVERVSLMDAIIMSRGCMELDELVQGDIDAGLYKGEPISDSNYEQALQQWEAWEVKWLMNKPSQERFELVKKRYGLSDDATLDLVCGSLCYYICDEELPSDYNN